MSVWGRYWWVCLFCVMTGLVYFHCLKGKKSAVLNLHARLVEMENEKLFALQKKEDLQLRIASQNDLGWIEMILMRDLGVVPEGFLKVHFKK